MMDIRCEINGRVHDLTVGASERLVDMLRDRLGLAGTKEGCGIGECGASTVLLHGTPVASCLVLAAQADGHRILTIEGLVAPDGTLHPVQQAFIGAGAIQCGFCTPAMVLCAYALLSNTLEPSEREIRTAISGTLCRCTGYVQIIEAIELAAQRMRQYSQ